MSLRAKRYCGVCLKYAVLLIISAILILPFLWMVSTSLKHYTQVFVFPPKLIPEKIVFTNYVDLFKAMPFWRYMGNSVIIGVLTTAGTTLIGSITAYAFAKIRFPGRDLWFLLFLAGLMIPVEVISVPLYLGLGKLGWVDSMLPLIVPQIFGPAGVFGLFILRQFFITVPDELVEAAKIDGCNHLSILFRIMMPMAMSAVATLVIFTFANSWNDFFQPLIFLNTQDNYTVPLGLAMFTDESGTKWHLIMAASSLATAPLLLVFFLCQRKFIESMAMSGIK